MPTVKLMDIFNLINLSGMEDLMGALPELDLHHNNNYEKFGKPIGTVVHKVEPFKDFNQFTYSQNIEVYHTKHSKLHNYQWSQLKIPI